MVVSRRRHSQQRTRRIGSFFGLSVIMELLAVDPIIERHYRLKSRKGEPVGA
jgi:hypothetical protein